MAEWNLFYQLLSGCSQVFWQPITNIDHWSTPPYRAPINSHSKFTGNDHERKPRIVEPVSSSTALSGHLIQSGRLSKVWMNFSLKYCSFHLSCDHP